ncbi:unnamed protein product [Hymenolepis diminuta]|uniref:Teneurin N-terminal domain-containing protein n=1 Tax=Hymenolepis diminuta TaxID=6216 RepID=A0A0R3STZ3_HYMDI|nr:unnamed protein product [Hymenolepis diminuta]VUZ50641.1 unnamed protein product [Hymenolepis diminuta]
MDDKRHSLENFKGSAFQNDKNFAKGSRYSLLSRDRLNVPTKGKEGRYLHNLSQEQSQRLISISSDEDSSCDIYNTGFVSSLAGDEMVEFLRRDGFNLDRQLLTTESDCPDLDLVPPHIVTKTRSACSCILCCSKCKTLCTIM